MANTRSKRLAPNSSTSATTPAQVKRRRRANAQSQQTAASRNQRESGGNGGHGPTASTSRSQSEGGGISNQNDQPRPQFDLDLSELPLSNYESAMDFWPINRINKAIASQTSANEKMTVVTFAHAQAVLERFEHTLHMIAMISGCSVAVLKRRLGLLGGTHGENTWRRWLSFSVKAQKHPMPVRGDPNAGAVLSFRNKQNAAAYQKLSDDEYSIYIAPIFYALGGYPNYSAINVTDLENLNLDDVLVPEVLQLSSDQEARFRPIYLKSVDLSKVTKDKEFNTPAETPSAIEKRSLQCFKKIVTQLARDSPLVGLEYMFIACSKSRLGEGWCRFKTTQDEMFSWLNQELNFQQLFPIYAQGGGTFEQIRKSLTTGSIPQIPQTRTIQKRDRIKTGLTAKITENLLKVLGSVPKQGWPRGRDPIQQLADHKINVVVRRDPQSSLSEELWQKGFKLMETEGRSPWLKDYENGYFELLPMPGPSATQQSDLDGSGLPAGQPEASGSGTITSTDSGNGVLQSSAEVTG